MRDATKIGRRACVSAMEAADKIESLFSAIERIADDDALNNSLSGTFSGLAAIGRSIAAELSSRMDHDETTLSQMDRALAETPGAT